MTTYARILLVVGIATACSDEDIRGHSKVSPDGQTYLVVDDDNGGKCGPLIVDGREWSQPVHEPGSIEPGLHRITCGDTTGYLAFTVAKGSTYHFDYWGP